MNILLSVVQRSRLDEVANGMADGFRGDRVRFDSTGVVLTLSVLGAGVVIAWVLAGWTERAGRRAGYDGPRRLFWSLCAAHCLKWSERWLLWRLAAKRRLGDPARVFVEPQWLSAAGLPQQQAERIQRLSSRLFGQSGLDPARIAETRGEC